MLCAACGKTVPERGVCCEDAGPSTALWFRARRMPLGNAGIVALSLLGILVLWLIQPFVTTANAAPVASRLAFEQQPFLDNTAYTLYQDSLMQLMASVDSPDRLQDASLDQLGERAARFTATQYAHLANRKPYANKPLLVTGTLVKLREDSWGENELLLKSGGDVPHLVAELESSLAQTLVLEHLKPGHDVEMLCYQSLLPNNDQQLSECYLTRYQHAPVDKRMGHRYVPTNADMLALLNGEPDRTIRGRMLRHAASAYLTLTRDQVCALTLDERCRLRFAANLQQEQAMLKAIRQHYERHGYNADRALAAQHQVSLR